MRFASIPVASQSLSPANEAIKITRTNAWLKKEKRKGKQVREDLSFLFIYRSIGSMEDMKGVYVCSGRDTVERKKVDTTAISHGMQI